MKRRRTLIISLLLVATLVLGIGYAGTTTTLKWTGHVENAPITFSVIFTGATIKEVQTMTPTRHDAVADACDPGTTGGNEISFSVAGLKEVGDTVTFTYTVTNNSDVDAKLNAPAFNPAFNSDYFNVTIGTWSVLELPASTGTATIDITVELIQVSDTNQSADFIIEALAEPLYS